MLQPISREGLSSILFLFFYQVSCIILIIVSWSRRVLELGCGIGCAGVSLCRLCCPSSYVFTDCHDAVLERLRENIHINMQVGVVCVAMLDC